LLESAILTLRS